MAVVGDVSGQEGVEGGGAANQLLGSGVQGIKECGGLDKCKYYWDRGHGISFGTGVSQRRSAGF